MRVGETYSVEIRARRLWNDTGLAVEAGGRYHFTASGIWRDLFIKHGPAGDPSPNFYMRWFEGRRRVTDADWLTLVGAQDRDMKTAFVIGADHRYTATSRGELTCFANDVNGFYWNNWGSVTLTVMRLA